LREAIDSEDGKNLLLNFEKVPYLDSTGLGEVVREA
jgi:anti-anti-sigma regulatory factor